MINVSLFRIRQQVETKFNGKMDGKNREAAGAAKTQKALEMSELVAVLLSAARTMQTPAVMPSPEIKPDYFPWTATLLSKILWGMCEVSRIQGWGQGTAGMGAPVWVSAEGGQQRHQPESGQVGEAYGWVAQGLWEDVEELWA